ncbi:MAG TPA: NUDIX hydrolase, partial [Candidatus Bathyarchaeia archaeon]|nr:NUDIX hydrolase [Candidatus Bathyarchaeia archaeon]
MNIQEAIQFLETQISDSREGLPQDIFFFASRITPMVNVDLLIKDNRNRMLLAWRDDEFAGTGWH